MGSIDRTTSRATPRAAPKTHNESLTAVGWIAIWLGIALFTLGAFLGGNYLLMGLGIAFCAGGSFSKKTAPTRLCPACQLAVPATASVCGHCRERIS